MSVFEVQTDNKISAFDSGYNPEAPTNADNFDSQTATGSSDDGPNRFTVWIPTEEVVMNLGNPVHDATVTPGAATATENTSDAVQVEEGFIVQTERHVQFHSYGAPAEVDYEDLDFQNIVGGSESKIAEAHTVIRLGRAGAAKERVLQADSADGSYGSTDANKNGIGTPKLIGSGYPEPYNVWSGYAMITEGGAYHESWGNHLVASRRGDVRIGGGRMVLIGSPGDVRLMADGDTLADVIENDTDASDLFNEPNLPPIAAAGKWVGYQKDEIWFNEILSGVSVAWAVVSTMLLIFDAEWGRSPTQWVSGWQPMSLVTDGLAIVGGVLAIAGGIYAMVEDLDQSIGGNIRLYASKSLTAYGAKSVTVHGGLAVSVSGDAVAQLSSFGATVVSGGLVAQMSAIAVQVTGIASAGLTSTLGTATLNGKSGTEVSSYGSVVVTGRDNVQVNATGGPVNIHGSTTVYIGAGQGAATPHPLAGTDYQPAAGFGICIDGTTTTGGVTIGAMQVANNFKAPSPQTTAQIAITANSLVIQHQGAGFTFQGGHISAQPAGGGRFQIC